MTAEAPPRAPAAPRATRPAAAVGVASLAAVLSALLLLGVTGSLAGSASPFDSGTLVRYALPAARAMHDLAASVTVGLLVVAAWFVAPAPGTDPQELSEPRRWLTRAATTASLAWLVAAVVVLVLTASDVSGIRVGAPGFFIALLLTYATQLDLGRSQLVSALLVAVVANLALLATRINTVAWAAALSLVALLPLALSGHASSAQNHMNSVDSLALHLVGVCLWVGGLAALVLGAHRMGDQLPVVVGRYSTLAGWCFVVVAGSGLVNAWLRLGSLRALGSTYGLLVVAKTVALGLLGLAGWAHRSVILRRLDEYRHWFLRLAVVELVVMSATLGLAVALSRSPAPAEQGAADPVSELLGFPAPPPLSVDRYFSVGYPDLLWLCVALGLAALYVAGAVVLHRRGDRWPIQRTVVWLAGCLLLVFVTSGGPGVYGRLHFSSHMLQHMTLMVIVPFLWVLGAPVTLAMRALPARRDRSFGPREMLLSLIHSRVLRVVGHPLVAAVLFTAGLIAFYYTPLFGLSLFTHTGHVLMTAHFLLTGYVFVWSLVGIDPGPARPSYPFRLLLLLVTLGFHAFFGISLMSTSTVLAPEWWRALGRTDTAALLADQQTGGSIAWAAGDIPSLLLGVALVVGWVRSDARETRRLDRQADRDDDADLRRYNEQLAAMARRDGSS